MTESTVLLAGAAEQPRIRGLTSGEAARRLAQGQANRTPRDSSRSYRRIVIDNAFTPINVILFAIGVALVIIGLVGDAVLTAGLVMVNVVVGVFQEARAKRQLDRIALLARPMAKVVRDGQEREILPEDIVVGDVLTLQPGDQVQVDGSVLEAEGFNVDESLLTGESDQVRKVPGDKVFSGTFCMTGGAYYEAEQVGAQSVANQITARARHFRVVRTPLQKETALVIWSMAVVVLVLAVAVLYSFQQIYGKFDLKETVRAAAVLAAMVPQGLSFMVTATYAMAAVRIGRGGALVQRLNAVESMSHIDVLCLDKTGTLTTNELALEALAPMALDEAELRRLLGDYAASASVTNRTNSAILNGCGGRERDVALEIPFDSSRKWGALAFAADSALYVLGAPEMIEAALAPGTDFRGSAGAWTARGLRVLLFARAGSYTSIDETQPRLPEGLVALGLVALRDELRADARETISGFAAGGIALKIISGDNPETVAALATQAGFGENLTAVAGPQLEGLDDKELERVAEENTIFGRIAPQHKEALVKALQRRGHYVAMTGDGVNDVPALKQSHVAIAVKSGSPVTRSVADIVLLNDSFSVLPAAFTEGQRIRNGMQAIIRLFLVRTIALSLAILGASLLLDPFPVSPRHSGALSLLTVGLPSLALAVWAKPGKTARYLLPASAPFILPAAITIGIVSMLTYDLYLYGAGGSVDKARTVFTMVSTGCGVLVIPFAQVPASSWGTLTGLRDDFRTTLLGLAMLAILLLSYFIVPVRQFYELVTIPAGTFGVVFAAVGIWWTVLVLIWRIDWTPAVRAAAGIVGSLRGTRARSEA